ncbi:hypothetical protein TGP89_312260 [Toxoplasma gondii p89]|uniref:WD domain, G-beta repeat-containing protein n=1 Tax=Toxoplasma gondii p89 TaxID=943119 RepID=A0A086L0V2_TOXGO|nr:hypothetical protein TGP89_312260 [Toxoplasma gondii p89]
MAASTLADSKVGQPASQAQELPQQREERSSAGSQATCKQTASASSASVASACASSASVASASSASASSASVASASVASASSASVASGASSACSVPALVLASLLPAAAHLERCYSVCCTDTHVFVGGGSISGFVCVWKLPGDLLSEFVAQQSDGDRGTEAAPLHARAVHTRGKEKSAEWQFVGVLGSMVSPVVQLKLNSTRERLAAVTQSSIGYIWDVSPAALSSLSALSASANVALSSFESLTSCSSLPSWLADVFAGDSAQSSSPPTQSKTALPASVSHLLHAGPKPVAVLGGSESPANVACVEFLPDGAMLAAGSSVPLSVDQVGREGAACRAPLSLYHCESGQRIAEFPGFVFSGKKTSHAPRAPLLLSSIAAVAMDPHKFVPPLPTDASTSRSASRWLAAGDAVCGCVALLLLPDGLLMQLRRQHESLLHAWNEKETRRLGLHQLRRRRDEASLAAAAQRESTPADAEPGEKERMQKLEEAAAEAEKAYQAALAEAAAAGDDVKDRDEEDENFDERNPMPFVQPVLLNLPTVVAQLSEAAPVEMTSLAWRPRRQGHRGSLHLYVACTDGFVRILQLNPVAMDASSQHTLQVRSTVLCKVASGTCAGDVRSLICLRPYSRRGHLTVAACNAFDFTSFASFASALPALSDAPPDPQDGAESSSKDNGSSAFYQVRVVEGLGEAGDEIAACIHCHADFICGVAASPSGVVVVSLAADKRLAVYLRSEAVQDRLKKDEEEKKRREAEEKRRREAEEEEKRRREAEEEEKRRREAEEEEKRRREAEEEEKRRREAEEEEKRRREAEEAQRLEDTATESKTESERMSHAEEGGDPGINAAGEEEPREFGQAKLGEVTAQADEMRDEGEGEEERPSRRKGDTLDNEAEGGSSPKRLKASLSPAEDAEEHLPEGDEDDLFGEE